MTLVKSWEEYKENWADLGRSFEPCFDYNLVVALVMVAGIIVIAVPCCIIGVAPSEKEL